MPDMQSVDYPALHHRDENYPFGNRVPRTVRMVCGFHGHLATHSMSI